jgi:hypothetical protein
MCFETHSDDERLGGDVVVSAISVAFAQDRDDRFENREERFEDNGFSFGDEGRFFEEDGFFFGEDEDGFDGDDFDFDSGSGIGQDFDREPRAETLTSRSTSPARATTRTSARACRASRTPVTPRTRSGSFSMAPRPTTSSSRTTALP